ncbi:isochorismatase family protein [Deltaproteobacteria bacterium TL4]
MELRKLSSENTALVVIDIQERLLKIMDEAIVTQTTKNVNLLTKMFHHWNAPILVTEQYVKGLGKTSLLIKENLAHVTPIEKITFSCCSTGSFDQALKALNKPNVLLTGMETHICVLQTALDLLKQDYTVYVLIDAVQSSTKLKWKYGLKLMEQAGVVLAPTETVLFQLLGQAATEDFKIFVNLLKQQN